VGRTTMSTRTRVCLYHTTNYYRKGLAAIKDLVERTYPYPTANWKILLKKAEGKTRNEKLLKMAEKLPPGFTLYLIQEPKRTRRNRSLYFKLIKQITLGEKLEI
jgi:hypothetical protein